MSDPFLTAVSVKVVSRWRGYAPLVDEMSGEHVFSRYPPPGFEFPADEHKYITVGDKTETDIRILGTPGSSLTLMAHGWTRGIYDDGPLERMVHLMNKALEEPLVLDGYGTVVLRKELAVVMGDPDPEMRHAPVRYRISTMGPA